LESVAVFLRKLLHCDVHDVLMARDYSDMMFFIPWRHCGMNNVM